jgi:hypothetical protein
MIDQQILQNIVVSIRSSIKNKSVDTTSVMKLVVICMEIMENMENVDIDKYINFKKNKLRTEKIKTIFLDEK